MSRVNRPVRRTFGTLKLEQLESRDVPSNLVVDSLLDTALADIPIVPSGGSGGAVITTEPGEVRATPPRLQYLTLRAAIELSERFDFNGPDTITFSGDILVQGQRVKIDLTSQLVKSNAAESLAIVGPGADHLAINGNTPGGTQCRILNYVAGTGLEITRITFLDGRSPTTGGGINVTAGAGLLKITECVFSGNQALNGAGGAINSANVPVQITTTNFLNNEATLTGGAIAVGSANLSVVSAMSVCLFKENKGTKGGAIAVMGNQMAITLTNVDFQLNTAKVEGGALYLSGGGTDAVLTASLVKFQYNDALGIGGKGLGGAVFLSTWEESQFTDCEFKGNEAEDEGGAVFVKGKWLEFTRCSFQDNSATIVNVVSYVGNLAAQVGGPNWLRIIDTDCTGFEKTEGVG